MRRQADAMSTDDDAELIRQERERHLTALRDIPARRARLSQHEHDTVRYARIIGISWDQIAHAIGSTADQARDKYGEPGPGEDPF